ncbi:thioredoxin domain-containing protein [Limisphaera sp. 4302-co]|uniref:thioredoxin domain-containing protein n=1 Tax=Limisphaera sp. 4302-co TaxID=3400417 RepID=UPI003C233F6C
MQTSGVRPANRLAGALSPYLLQHAHNPVDWYPWCGEAFARARAEDKPVFLSIGYATCHWCHVMERESFEDPRVAEFLNAHFVSIKVDREERPDLDRYYMAFVQATAGEGGWPLSVFLTPEGEPFFGGTYFPPEPRHGRPSFMMVLRRVAELWRQRRGEICRAAADLRRQLVAALDLESGPAGLPGPALLRRAAERILEHSDPVHGGFGGAPKFPQPVVGLFLLAVASRVELPGAVEQVLLTCDRMAAGGIHDQLGGGFARYSVDERWLVPHFEKMLYDQAQLAHLYLEAYLTGGQPRHAAVVRDILEYVLRDLRLPEGGFASGEDADSEGQEGRFYCWTDSELREVLTPEEYAVAARYFGVTREGNFVDHSHPDPVRGLNVLSVADPEVLNDANARVRLATAVQKMREARARRPRPARDDKVLASWNGLMLGALARAGAVLGEPRYVEAARQNLAFLQSHLWEAGSAGQEGHGGGGGRLWHEWRAGRTMRVRFLEDYAFLLDGLLWLYEATLAPEVLAFARELAGGLLRDFYDKEGGGFWMTPSDGGESWVRLKRDSDGAEPGGNSLAVQGMLRLAAVTGRAEYEEAALRTIRAFAGEWSRVPTAYCAMLRAAGFAVWPVTRVWIRGSHASSEVRALLGASHAVYDPFRVILGSEGPVSVPAGAGVGGEGACAVVCRRETCLPPVKDPEGLRRLLGGTR